MVEQGWSKSWRIYDRAKLFAILKSILKLLQFIHN